MRWRCTADCPLTLAPSSQSFAAVNLRLGRHRLCSQVECHRGVRFFNSIKSTRSSSKHAEKNRSQRERREAIAPEVRATGAHGAMRTERRARHTFIITKASFPQPRSRCFRELPHAKHKNTPASISCQTMASQKNAAPWGSGINPLPLRGQWRGRTEQYVRSAGVNITLAQRNAAL